MIRSVGGPQLCLEFVKFCNDNQINHEVSSPYNPRANGLAKSGVKIAKNIFLKCINEKGDMQRVLCEWRNMPIAHGLSPAKLLFGRNQNMLLPQSQAVFSPIDFGQAALARD